MKISVVIATLDRPLDLRAALDSLLRQTLPPCEVIVVDQSRGDQSLRVFLEAREKRGGASTRFLYLRQEEKSLVKARNRGMAAAEGEIVSFLDDDVVLLEDYYEKLAEHFHAHPEVGGLSGNVLVGRGPSGAKWRIRRALLRFFLLNRFDGKMTRSGFGYPIFEREIERWTPVELLVGCNMSYRRAAVAGAWFDEWFTGYSFREDSDFSYRIAQNWVCAMVPDAGLHHNYSRQNRLDGASLRRMEIRNYAYLYGKHRRRGSANLAAFLHSLAGLVLLDGLEFLFSFDPGKFLRFAACLRSSLRLALRRGYDAG